MRLYWQKEQGRSVLGNRYIAIGPTTGTRYVISPWAPGDWRLMVSGAIISRGTLNQMKADAAERERDGGAAAQAATAARRQSGGRATKGSAKC